MTYCVGFLLDSGLVFASDSRTNAGVDYISTYSKMHVFQPADDRLFVLLAAGNLATTQAVLNRIQRDLLASGVDGGPGKRTGAPVGGGAGLNNELGGIPEEPAIFAETAAPPTAAIATDDADRPAARSGHASVLAGGPPADAQRYDLLSARYLFEAADYVGRLSVAVQQEFGHALRQSGASAEATFILGGQILGDRHGLYLIYPQGNAVMATRDTPFLQIGESKYGKPPLDLVGHCGLSLEDAARLCLISQIITRRSNLTVGPPFELALMPRDELRISRRVKLAKRSPEIGRSLDVWSRTMQEGLARLPRFAWEEDPL
jgi:putative proteasome-type protease